MFISVVFVLPLIGCYFSTKVRVWVVVGTKSMHPSTFVSVSMKI